MKIEKHEPEFTPITITIETQDELDKLAAVFNWIPIWDILGRDDSFYDTMFNSLAQFSGSPYFHHFRGKGIK